ncbi:MAG TPA: outer membrane protein assembly factor BamD, partial [Polyangiaceae bacterium]
MSTIRSAAIAVLLVCSLPGCATTARQPMTAQRYDENARTAYQAALAEFEDKDWETATSMFEQVKREYAYS